MQITIIATISSSFDDAPLISPTKLNTMNEKIKSPIKMQVYFTLIPPV